MWLCGWLAGRSREGQEAKRMRLEKKKGGGELRTPLQASEQVWTAAAGAQSTLSKAASGIGTSSPAEMHKHWAIVNNLGSCLVFFFSKLWHWTSVTGSSAGCPNAARRAECWICHRWKGGERQAVARCTEQRGKMKQARAVRWGFVSKILVPHGNEVVHNV